MLKEFKPAIWFLVKFFVFFFAISLFYQFLYLNKFNKEGNVKSDGITKEVTIESGNLLQLFGYNTKCEQIANHKNMSLQIDGKEILQVMEPCNGVNIIILFAAFVFAYGGEPKRMFVFIVSGIAVIHIFNIIRIALLAVVQMHYPSQMYFFHKYAFTGIIYLVIVILWVLWVNKFSKKNY